MRFQKGFSVLELMVTVGIIAIIGAVGMPAIDNFGDQENYQADVATIRGQFNYVRQLSLEDGSAYRIKIVNNDSDNRSTMEVWRAQGLNRYNVEYHKGTDPTCDEFGGSGDNGEKITEHTKILEHITIKKCTSTENNCTTVSADDNYFCFLPDGTAPESARGLIKSSSNAGNREEYLHFYHTGFFNNGNRMSE